MAAKSKRRKIKVARSMGATDRKIAVSVCRERSLSDYGRVTIRLRPSLAAVEEALIHPNFPTVQPSCRL